MSINRRHLAVPVLAAGLSAAGLLAAVPAFAQSSDATVVGAQVEAFRVAMVAKDGKAFDMLAAPQMTYAHSDGRVETKDEFITASVASKNKWASLAFQDTKVQVVDNAAVVRFKLIGETEQPDGKKNPINIGILMVWQKQSGNWKLLARHAVRLTT